MNKMFYGALKQTKNIYTVAAPYNNWKYLIEIVNECEDGCLTFLLSSSLCAVSSFSEWIALFLPFHLALSLVPSRLLNMQHFLKLFTNWSFGIRSEAAKIHLQIKMRVRFFSLPFGDVL